MLEGKEVEGNIGKFGSYSADVNDKGEVEVSVGIKIDLIAELEKLAAKSGNQIDDKIIALIKSAIGR